MTELKYLPTSGIFGSLSMQRFIFRKYYQRVFESGCRSSHTQQRMNVPIARIFTDTWYCQHFSVILVQVSWPFTVVFICIFLMSNDVVQFFMSFLASWVSFCEIPSQIFCPFFFRYIASFILFMEVSYISFMRLFPYDTCLFSFCSCFLTLLRVFLMK